MSQIHKRKPFYKDFYYLIVYFGTLVATCAPICFFNVTHYVTHYYLIGFSVASCLYVTLDIIHFEKYNTRSSELLDELVLRNKQLGHEKIKMMMEHAQEIAELKRKYERRTHGLYREQSTKS